MKKITLIEPKAPGYHFFSGRPMPRLGLPILGTILKQRGYDVKIYYQEIYPIDFAEVFKSDIVGISTITSTAPEAYRIAKLVKKNGIPVIIGGVHPTFLPDEALAYADYVIRGEGEETIVELIDAIENGEALENILGLSYKRDGEYHHNPDRPPMCDLDSIPAPDLSLIIGFNKLRIIPVYTSRGCPYNCTFCSVTPMFGRKYRFRSPDSIVEEVSRWKGKHIFFVDDNFAADKERAKILLDMMIRKGSPKEWSTQIRAEAVKDEELLHLMRCSNCSALCIGYESVNPKALKEFNKHLDLNSIRESVELIHKYGIRVHGMFIFGADEDNLKTFSNTVNFVKETGIDTVQFAVLVPLPGTKLFEQLESQNRIITKDWHLYDGHHVVFRPMEMSPYGLQQGTLKALKSIYSFSQFLRFLLRRNFYGAGLRLWGYGLIKKWSKDNNGFLRKMRYRSRAYLQESTIL
ncbi:MAG TPA: B12-binding domain-containing radical SAM protein [bacterium (Candidatus Stahlbacteria)]|nr:B12-binding domain-containing radical SAM protein [Candidatus Stahlbacteria bacterium]